MTKDEKRQWLTRGLIAGNKADQIAIELKEIRGRYYKAPSFDNASSHPKYRYIDNDLSVLMAKIDKIERKYLDALITEHKLLLSISDAIEGSAIAPPQKEIFFQRYIDGKSWDEIAESMEMTTRHAARLHSQGLEVFEVPEREKE